MAESLNILHISFHKDWRGGEQQATYLIGELRKKKCYQWILCLEGNAMEKYCEQNGLPYYSLKPGFLSNFSNRHILNDIVSRHKINIVHTHDSKAHTLAYFACNENSKAHLVVHRRVDFPVKPNYLSKKKYNSSCISKFICVSNKVLEVLAPSISDKSKLTVIHDGIDPDRFKDAKDLGILRKTFHISPKTKIIGNTSALADHKDYFTFVDTAEILIKQNLDAKFFIIGEGSLKSEIEQYIKTKSLESHIVLTGFRNDIPQIMPELDLFLMTSKTEGLGTSLLDAMACNVPIVSTNAGGIPEIVHHLKTGLLAEVKDSKKLAELTVKVFSDNELRETIIKNAYQMMLGYSKQIMAEKTFELYKAIHFSAT